MRHPLLTLLVALGLWGCSDNAPPVLGALDDQRAFVNFELTVALSARDDDGDPLTFGFDAELDNIRARAKIEPNGAGRALFHWTPLVSDVGVHQLEIFASDGEAEARKRIYLDVALSGEGSTAPVFVRPLGTGTTLDLSQQSCLDVPVVVEDPDSANVSLAQEEPVIDGAAFDQDGDLSGRWSWCPSKEQVAAGDRYTLTLSADDGDNAVTLKSYLVVLRGGSGEGCPGQAPLVDHQPESFNTVNDLTVVAQISDDQGMKYEPLFYYSTTPPGDPPVLMEMTQLTMVLLDGDVQDGSWGAAVPNPVANSPSGSSAQLYYLIVAQDNDDENGTCDHLTQAPATGSYTVTVTNPGGSGGLGLCASCTADIQCGGASDLCVFLGGAYHCGTGCTDSSQCSDGNYCSFSSFTSIDGAIGRQCIPNDYQCQGGGGGGCVDDGFEDNDTRSQASSGPALSPGSYGTMKSCPAQVGDDEDWYRIVLSSEGTVTASISGGDVTDLDLTLTDSNGAVIDTSDSLSSNEAVSSCLGAGTYYLHVFAYGTGENSYGLDYDLATGSCGGSCQDDAAEDDDSLAEARLVDLNQGAYVETGQAICAWDDDWYEVYLYGGETLRVTLDFLQSSPQQDIDIYVFDDSSTNLTVCDEQHPADCDPFNGQSGTSNETLDWPISSSGNYYVVIHGWNGSENDYDICVGLSATDCP